MLPFFFLLLLPVLYFSSRLPSPFQPFYFMCVCHFPFRSHPVSCLLAPRSLHALRCCSPATVKLAKDLAIEKSCSILINDRLVCVHDGGWKDCPDGHQASDFERLIRKEYEALNP